MAFYIPSAASYGKAKNPKKDTTTDSLDSTDNTTDTYTPLANGKSDKTGFYVPNSSNYLKNYEAKQKADQEERDARQAKIDAIKSQGEEDIKNIKAEVYKPANILGDITKAAGGVVKAGANIAKDTALSVYNSGKNTVQNAEKVIESTVRQNDYSTKVAAAKDAQNYIDSQLKKGLISQETASKKKQSLLDELNKSAVRSSEAVKRTSAIDARQAAADAADTTLNIGTLGLGSVLPKALIKGGAKAAAELAAKNIGEKAGVNTAKKLAGDVANNAIVGGGYGASSAARNNDNLQTTAQDIATGAAIGGAIPLVGKALSTAAQKAGLNDIAKNVFNSAAEQAKKRLGRELTPNEMDTLATRTGELLPDKTPTVSPENPYSMTPTETVMPESTAPKINAVISPELQSAPRIHQKIETVDSDKLKLGPDTIDEAGLDQTQVQKYVDDIKAGKPIDPIVVTKEPNGEILVQDGKHRLAAAEELGIKEIPTVERLPKDQTLTGISDAANTRSKADLQKAFEDAKNTGDTAKAAEIAKELNDSGLSVAERTPEQRAQMIKDAQQRAKLALKEQTPTVNSDNKKTEPIISDGTKKKNSRVFERMQAEHPDELTGDFTYNPINLKNEAAKAVELVDQDKQKAYRIAMGAESSAEHTQTGVNIAMSEQALADGNNSLFAQLIKKRSLDQTRRGQEIVSERGSIADNSTSRYVKELLRDRMEKVGRTPLGDLRLGKMGSNKPTKMQNAIEHVNKEVAKAEKAVGFKHLDMKAAQAIIDGLACK